MPNVGYATLQIIPSIRGIEAAIARDLDAPLASTGKRAGVKLGEAVATGVKESGGKVKAGLASTTDEAANSAESSGRSRFQALGRALGTVFTGELLSSVGTGRTQLARAINAEADEVAAEVDGRFKRLGERAGEKFKEGATETVKTLGGAVFGVGLALGIGEVVKQSLEAADRLEGANIRIDGAFGESADRVKKWALTLAGSIGQSATDAENAAGKFGQMFHAMGVGQDEAATMAEKLDVLSVNVAKFNNSDPATVQQAFTAAMRGRGKALAQLGINLDSTTIAAEALSHGIVATGASAQTVTAKQDGLNMAIQNQVKFNRAAYATYADRKDALDKVGAAHTALANAMAGAMPVLTASQKGEAAYYAILDGTKNQQDAVAKSTKTLAQQKAILAAQIQNIEAQLGTKLLPSLTKLATYVTTTVIPAVTKFGDWISKNRATLEYIAKDVLFFFAAFKGYSIIMSARAAVLAFVAAGGGLDAIRLKAMYARDAIGGMASKIGGALKTASSAMFDAGKAAGTMAFNIAKNPVEYARTGAAALASGAKLVFFKGVQLAVAAATKTWAAIQWTLNAALTGNPIGILIVAIAALVAGIIIAYKNSATFRDIVDKVGSALKTVAEDGIRILKLALKDLLDVFLAVASTIVTAAASAFGWVPGLGGKLKEAARKINEFKNSVNSALGDIHDKQITITETTVLTTVKMPVGDTGQRGPNGVDTSTGKVSSGPETQAMADASNARSAAQLAAFNSANPIPSAQSATQGIDLGGGNVAADQAAALDKQAADTAAKRAASTAASAAKAAANAATAAAKAAATAAATAAANAAKAQAAQGNSALLTAGKNLLKPLTDGIRSHNLNPSVIADQVRGLTAAVQTAYADHVAVNASAVNRVITLNRQLQAEAGYLATNVTALATARTALTTAHTQFLADAKTASDAVTGSFDIKTAGQNQDIFGHNVRTTASSILADLKKKVSAASSFAGELGSLRKAGLNSTLLQELANAGPDAEPQARALASASKAQLAAINGGYSQLAAAGANAGNQVATAVDGPALKSASDAVKRLSAQQVEIKAAMQATARAMAASAVAIFGAQSPASTALYNAGANAGVGIVRGLQSQQPALEATMTAMAYRMQLALKRALGIRSPSTKLRDEVGKMVPLGMAAGIDDNAHHVVRAAKDLANAAMPRSAFPAGGTNTASAAPVASTTHNWSIDARGSDGVALAEDIARRQKRLAST